MDLLNLNTVWFLLVGALFTGYAMLDGFDLGVGAIHLLVKKDEHRRLMLNAIGPVWDGNEVWLVVGGGSLLGAFPEAYATVFSGFYLPFIFLLFTLIFRAVAIEFRSKEVWPWWRETWDIAFSVGSILSAFIIGVAMGNVVQGVPLDDHFELSNRAFNLLNPYALLMGVTTVLLFAMHGAIYVLLKTEGELQAIIRGWIPWLIGLFLASYAIFNLYTLVHVPYVWTTCLERPHIFIIAILGMLVLLNVPRSIYQGREFIAFLSSCAGMAFMMATFGFTYYPNMLLSAPNPENSLTIYNAASTQKTLGILLVIAGIGVPLVLGYTISIYYIFRGKTRSLHY
jgi:cytochrome d ubiquinol oxidase subunit II